MLTSDQRTALADRLRTAERDRVPIPPLIEQFPELTPEDAYEIQLVNIRRRLADVDVVGHKVGLSSRVMQQMMGVDEPDYGHLLSDMRLSEHEPVRTSRYLVPRVEVEVGFVLGADLPGDDCTEADVLACTEALVPAIELIDSRIADWKISIGDTIADNASSAGFVLGAPRTRPSELDVRAIEATLWQDDDRVAQGRSDAVLGDPTTAVAWLARKVAGYGVRLRAGNVVLPGSCTKAFDAVSGSCFRADFTTEDGPWGSVSLTFTQEGTDSGHDSATPGTDSGVSGAITGGTGGGR
ncbi:2-keto-4-pentenoate hydratase [Allosaccharopolyspora coralli]|uniref:2-keto-4-pentenoate hydratase n=1 Tax=Allosaccharopolyspora coralli TaxID=2665642 RepID=UPI001C9E5D47|nr:2-keto-4-pentenoate hydratase [Allosaccharopolyspora coralli]